MMTDIFILFSSKLQIFPIKEPPSNPVPDEMYFKDGSQTAEKDPLGPDRRTTLVSISDRKEVLKTLWLQESSKDMVIWAGGMMSVSCHAALFSAVSEYSRQLLESHETPITLHLPGVSHQSVTHFVQMLYGFECPVEQVHGGEMEFLVTVLGIKSFTHNANVEESKNICSLTKVSSGQTLTVHKNTDSLELLQDDHNEGGCDQSSTTNNVKTEPETFDDICIESGLNSLHPSTVKRKLSKNKQSSINTRAAKPLPSREKMQCPKCPVMVAKCHVLKHERLHHDENLPYGCDICSYRSLLPFSIKSHKGLHHKEKKFVCRLGCGQAYTTSGYRQVLLNLYLCPQLTLMLILLYFIDFKQVGA